MGSRREWLQPLFRRGDAEGSTDHVRFVTRKEAVETVKSHVSHVVLDGPTGGNTWEDRTTAILEAHPGVVAFVKNDRLGFDIPYVHQGRSHRYVPDFLIRLAQSEDDPVVRTLILEVSGSRKSPGPTRAKAATARDQWCAAVNNQGDFGRWGYAELTDITDATGFVDEAIRNVYADAAITGTLA